MLCCNCVDGTICCVHAQFHVHDLHCGLAARPWLYCACSDVRVDDGIACVVQIGA